MDIIQEIMNSTESQKSLSASISLIQYKALPVLLIKHSSCQAAISLQGAHLLSWQPAGQKESVLWLSERSQFTQGESIRGGVPICWPWFGLAGSPPHGFARLVLWQLTQHNETQDGVELLFTLKNSEQTKPYWSDEFELEMKMTLGKTCQLQLTSKGDFSATTALHTYFNISDIEEVTVSQLGFTYQDRLSTENKPKVEGTMTFNQEVDRIYTQPKPVTYIKDNRREIELIHVNNSDLVVWNPWKDKAKAVADLSDDSYRQFVCVETSRVNSPIDAANSQEATYGVTISVKN